MNGYIDNIRMEVVACLASANGVDAEDFSKFGPVTEEVETKTLISEILSMSADERVQHIVEKLRSLVAHDEFHGLTEVHPAWLVEVLSHESPRIIGIILRYLPSKQSRFIIENLPRRIKSRLPQLIDSFAVPAPILKIIKDRFERKFYSEKANRDFDTFEFKNIPYLKIADLETLFKDVGIHELALALKGIERSSLNILFNRLSVVEARNLQQRIRSLTDVPPALLRDAKYTVLEMSLTESDPQELILDVGLNSFAHAFSEEDAEILPFIKQKLAPKLGYTLKRYIDEHGHNTDPNISKLRKEMILERISALSRAGAIDESLKNFFAVTEEGKSIEPEGYTQSSEEIKSDSWHEDERVVV